jgi:PiT family inorganic phosphate transporter
MEAHDIVLVLVVVTALAFDFTNGFHDTANAMATRSRRRP